MPQDPFPHTSANITVPRLVTAQQLKDVIGMEPKSIYSAVAKGHIPCVRIGPRRMRFDVAEVLAYCKKDDA